MNQTSSLGRTFGLSFLRLPKLPPEVIRPTREGKRFLFATFLVGLASFNTGNNLIYLVFGMMLSIFFIAVVLLRVNLSGISLRVSLEGMAFAGQRARMSIDVLNSKKRFTSYSLRIHLPEGLAGQAYVELVGPASDKHAVAEVVFEKRGVYSYGSFEVESGFPFIFFTKRIRVRVSGQAIVYPEVMEVELGSILKGTGGEAQSLRPGRSEELLMLKEFGRGDEVRHVHWKATAKAGKMMVRQFGEEEPLMVTVALDDVGDRNERAFERAVSFAASAAWRLMDEGYYVSLVSCSKVLPFGGGTAHLLKLLDILAVIREKDSLECPVQEQVEGACILILKSPGSALERLAPVSAMVVYATDL